MNMVTASGTAGICRIGRSITKQIGLTVGSFLFVAIGWWMISDPAATTRNFFDPFIGWVGVLFFGFCGVGWAYRLAFGERWPVTLSPQGLTDLRVSKTLIPWRAVKNVEAKTIGKTPFLQVDFDEDLKLELSMFGRMVQAANLSKYGCRYWLTSADLKLAFPKLHELVHTYWLAHGSPKTPSGPAPNSEIKGA
jgi:hypothetical protein